MTTHVRAAALIALVLAGCIQPGAPPPEASTATLRAREPFEVAGCRAITLVWLADAAAVAAMVAPYEPASTTGGRATVALRAIDCPEARLADATVADVGGVAVLVAIEQPDDTGGEDAARDWVAMPYLFGWDGPIAERFVLHGFQHVNATLSLQVSPLAAPGQTLAWTLETETGRLDVQGATTLGGPVAWDAALLSPTAGRFSAISGHATVESRGNGAATVTWTGTSVLDGLGLDGPPQITGDDEGLALDFEFIDAAGTA